MQNIIIIPARIGSTRFPNKPLAYIKGKTLINRVWDIAKHVNIDRVVVSTDSLDIKKHVEEFGGEAVLTTNKCLTGTDRTAETIKILNQPFNIIVNLQGDAALTPPWIIEKILTVMQKDTSIQVASPIIPLRGKKLEEFILYKQNKDASGTTVVFDKNHNALYFSKNIIPAYQNTTLQDIIIYRHIGLYAYKKDALLKLAGLPQSRLEQLEQLEQLRALENNIPIRVIEVDYKNRTHGSINSPQDITVIENIIDKEGELIL